MNNIELDRRLRRWMADREPGTVPTSVLDLARTVPGATPVPARRRVQGALVAIRPTGGLRPMGIVIVLALLVGMSIVALLVGSRPPAPVPGVDRWGAFEVGQPAPTVIWKSPGGSTADDDDRTVEFEDLVGSVVVVLVPASDPLEPGVPLAELVEARRQAGDGAHFLVGTRSADGMEAISSSGLEGIDLSEGRLAAAFPDSPAALVVIDQAGRVAYIFTGSLPPIEQLNGLVRALLEVAP